MEDGHHESLFARNFLAVATSVREIRGAITAAVAARVAQHLVADIALASTEAATNCVVHAFIGREPGVISVEVWHDRPGALLIVVIRDDGIGFRPRADSPGLGLGLPMITALTQELTLSHPRVGGTELRMSFDAQRSP
jgi:serine/threonine-protein kinase RsbW/stage II sporulation protein AB (anti-sigma F factor)